MLFRELQRMTVKVIQERIKAGDCDVTADGEVAFRLSEPGQGDCQSTQAQPVEYQEVILSSGVHFRKPIDRS